MSTPKIEQGALTAMIYQSIDEHLADELVKLEALLRLQVLRFRSRHVSQTPDAFAGLYITDEEINQALSDNSTFQSSASATDAASEIQTQLKQIESLQTAITARIEESIQGGIVLPLCRLGYLFHLTPFEVDALLICLAPELDLKYETLYAYLHNDVTRKSPTINLILDLLCRSSAERLKARTYFSPQAPFLKYDLLQFTAETHEKPLLSRSVQLDERIVNFLLGFNLLDARLNAFTDIITPQRGCSTVVLDESLKARLHRLANAQFTNNPGQKLTLALSGPNGAGKKLTAEALCQEALLVCLGEQTLHVRRRLLTP